MTDGSTGNGAQGPRVVVVGGSMGGLLAGNMLYRAGCDVTVHERIGTELAERGVGIATHPELHADAREPGAFHRRCVRRAAGGAHHPGRPMAASSPAITVPRSRRPGGIYSACCAATFQTSAIYRRRQLHRLRAPRRRRACALRGRHQYRGRSPDRRRRRALHRSPPALAGCGAAGTRAMWPGAASSTKTGSRRNGATC